MSSRHQTDIHYTINNGEVAVTPDFLNLQGSDSQTRAKHKLKYNYRVRTDKLNNSFVNDMIPQWNHLPALVVEADSVTLF